MSTIEVLAATFVAAFLGAAIPLFYIWWSGRTERGIALFRELNSSQFSEIRNNALIFIRKNPDLKMNHDLSFEQEKESIPVWILARYFQNVLLHLDSGNVQSKYLLPRVGPLFVWWNVNWFERSFDPEWDIGIDLRRLNQRIIARIDPSLYANWYDRAMKDLLRAEQRRTLPGTTSV